MPRAKFLKIFAIIEMFSAVIFLSLGLIFYLSKDTLGGGVMIPVTFASIGVCALIAAPILFAIAKKHESPANYEPEIKNE
jgi:hypothetical protein